MGSKSKYLTEIIEQSQTIGADISKEQSELVDGSTELARVGNVGPTQVNSEIEVECNVTDNSEEEPSRSVGIFNLQNPAKPAQNKLTTAISATSEFGSPVTSFQVVASQSDGNDSENTGIIITRKPTILAFNN